MKMMSAQLLKGSSPRVRGTLSLSRVTWSRLRAHPRGCGEHTVAFIHYSNMRGSSPRVRGT